MNRAIGTGLVRSLWLDEEPGISLTRPSSAVWISGTVQTIFYCDFFYYYIKSWRNNERLKLPS
jgi:hypothetical protein